MKHFKIHRIIAAESARRFAVIVSVATVVLMLGTFMFQAAADDIDPTPGFANPTVSTLRIEEQAANKNPRARGNMLVRLPAGLLITTDTYTSTGAVYTLGWDAGLLSWLTLDQAYDNGSIIDFTGAVPVDFKAVSAHDPSYFHRMYFDNVLAYSFSTGPADGNAFRLYTVAGVSMISFSGYSGETILNAAGVNTGNFTWYGTGSTYAKGDANLNTFTLVPLLYIGDADDQGYARVQDGDGEYDGFTCVNTDASRDYETMPPTAPEAYAGRVLYDSFTTGSVYHANWAGDRASFQGALDNHTGNVDLYAYCGPGAVGSVQYGGSSATTGVGIAMPWDCTIVGIGACAMRFSDLSDVATLDIYPYADGAQINAACKATLPEAIFPAGPEITATFAAGTYNVTAGQRLGIWLDIVGDVNLNDSSLQNLVVTVWYQMP